MSLIFILKSKALRLIGLLLSTLLAVACSGGSDPDPQPPQNNAPSAIAQSVMTYENISVDIILEGTDQDGTISGYTINSNPAIGTLSGIAPNLTYTPKASMTGSDSFMFFVTDNDGADSNPAQVSITINVAIGIAPTATAQNVAANLNTPVDIILEGTDADGTIESYTVVTNPNKGLLSGTLPNLVYTPNNDLSGSDIFTFSVTDNDGMISQAATVSIAIDPLRSTLQGRTDGKGVDLVITGDAFTVDQMSQFHQAVDNYVAFMFGYNSVFIAQQGAWNVHRLDTISATSDLNGVTAFESYYNCFDIPRLLCLDNTAVFEAVAQAFPQYDYVLVLVNSTIYGGSGGPVSVASLHPSANHIALHEIGHTFAGLADEYPDGNSSAPVLEPMQPNVTINNDLATVKWNHWTDDPVVDLFEGALYTDFGVWRPTEDSIMRTLGQPFYPVNQEAWSLAVYSTTGTHHSQSPVLTNVSHTVGSQIQFEIEPAIGASAQNVDWFVNSSIQQSGGFTMQCCQAQLSNYTVQAIITDTSTSIRKDDSNLSTSTINWSVTVQ